MYALLNSKAPFPPYTCSLKMNEKSDSNKCTLNFPYGYKVGSTDIGTSATK